MEKVRFFYHGKELKDSVVLESAGFLTESKNEEGILERLSVGILVHPVKKAKEGTENGKVK